MNHQKKFFIFYLLLAASLLLLECAEKKKKPPEEVKDIAEEDVVDVIKGEEITADIPVDKEVPVDIVPDDISVDIVPDDISVDIPPDKVDVIEEIVPPPSSAGYRLSLFTPQKPLFCPPKDSNIPLTCQQLTELIGEYIDEKLNSTEEPLDILLMLFLKTDPVSIVKLVVGNALCEREDGKIKECGFLPEANLVEFENVTYEPPNSPNKCEEETAPCFITEKKDFAWKIMEIIYGLNDGYLYGHLNSPFKKDDFIDDGTIKGFFPEALAKSVLITIPQFGDFYLSELLNPEEIKEYKGKKGWFVEIRFNAVWVNTK